MPSRGRGGRSPSKRKPPLPPEARPRSTGPTVARTATPPIPPAPNIVETIAAADGNISPRGNTIDIANSPNPPAPTTVGGDNGPSGSTISATIGTTTTIGGGIATTTAIGGDINASDNISDDTTGNTTPLGGEANSGGDSFDNNNNINNDSISQATTDTPHPQFGIDQLESIIQRAVDKAVDKSVAEAVDKAFTSTLTDISSKGYRLVNKVFDDLLDHRKRREESSKQEYRRYTANPESYFKDDDDDSTNASVNTPTVTRPPTPTVTFSPNTTVTPRTAPNTSLQQLMDNHRPGNSANWDATHARVQTINTGAEAHIDSPSHNNQCLQRNHTDINAEDRIGNSKNNDNYTNAKDRIGVTNA